MDLCKNPAELVIEAGKLLQERDLVVRTWGNVSIRTDPTCFYITPTGARYETIEKDDIVQVNLETLEATGRCVPSSELFVHAKIYQNFPHVCFILHTHQKWASILTLFSYGKRGYLSIGKDWANILGNTLPSAEYAEAGTEKIAQNLIDSILLSFSYSSCRKCTYSAFNANKIKNTQHIESGLALMAHHGVVVFAKNAHHAFTLADKLEEYAKSVVVNKLKVLNTRTNTVFYPYTLEDPDNLIEQINDNMFFISSEKYHLLSYLGACLSNYKTSKKFDSDTQAETVQNNIKEMGAYFDDVAQIAGSCFRIVNIKDASNASITEVGKGLTDSRILLIRGKELILLSPSREEACYMIRLFEKNILAFLISLIDKKIKPIPRKIAQRLHTGYLTNYSKRAGKNNTP